MTSCACIDIGSNTTRLLVAERADGRLREVASERAFTLLGAAGSVPSAIGQDKIDEIVAVVAHQVGVAGDLGVVSLRVVATAAVRGAADSGALAAAIEAACGARLEILAAEDEARLAFRGAIGMLDRSPPGLLAVVDVGGGSTEIVAGTAPDGATWSVSLPLGSSVVTHAEPLSDPPTPAELARVRAMLEPRFAALGAPQPAVAYVVGGSATSMQRLMGAALDRDALELGLRALVVRPAAEVALRLGLHAARARLLPAAILLLDAASRALRAPLQFAGGGLREGVVFEQLAALES